MATIGTSGHQRAAAGRARNAAGTRTATGIVRGWLRGRPAGRAADDLDDLRRGTTLFVAAFSRRGPRFEQGRLVLRLGAPDPIVWQSYRPFRGHGPGVPVSRPYDVQGVGPVTGPGSRSVKRDLFRLITLHADGRLRELAVPTTDVPLVRAAMSARTA